MDRRDEERTKKSKVVVSQDNSCRQPRGQVRQSSATQVTEATYDSNRGGDGSNFGNPTFEAPVNIKARQNEPGTETVVVGPRSNTNTAGRTQYTNNTGGIATVYGNATYKKEYNVN